MLEVIGELPSSLGWIEAHGCPSLETETSSSLLWSSLLKHLKSPIQQKFNIIIPGSSGIPEWVSHQRMGCEVSVELPMNWYEDNNLLGFVLFFHHVPLDDDDECVRTSGFIPHCKLAISHGDQSKRLDDIGFHPHCKTYSISGLSYGSTRYDSGSTSDPALWVTYFPQIGIPSKYRSRKVSLTSSKVAHGNMTNYWLWNWKGGRDAVLNQNDNAIKETFCLDCGF
ncbi:unnamed protein product, partial [Vitis vinifera]